MTEEISIYFTTNGPVRGSCNHRHRKVQAAVLCAKNDHAGCVRQGGYSDRSVLKMASTGEVLAQIDEETLEEIS